MEDILTADDAQLLLRLKGGDALAFGLIYDRYKDRLGHNLLHLLKSDILVEEVLQDVFLKIWEQRASIDPTRSFKAYLYRIAENRVCDFFRKAAKERGILQEIIAANSELYTHVEEALLRKENSELLNDVLARLPYQRKRIFVACKLEGKSYKEVAEEFGISTTTVNDHIQKAMQYLKANVHRIPAGQFMFLVSVFLLKK